MPEPSNTATAIPKDASLVSGHRVDDEWCGASHDIGYRLYEQRGLSAWRTGAALTPPAAAAIDEGLSSAPAPSPYLLLRRRTLREVCRTGNRDGGGKHCPECVLRDLCEKQAQRAAAAEA
jgi:hypothetical protein